MTKPDDVPQDVWDRATDTHRLILNAAIPSEASAILRIAGAIMAEREACAQTVDTLADVLTDEISDATKLLSRQVLSAQRHAVQTAAAAIRRRSE